MTPQQYCQDKVAGSGSSFYYSFLFLTEERREAIMALYAFCREVDDVVDECSDANIAQTKLQWWRDEVARTFAGNPNHPVGKALLPVLERYNLPQEYFQEIIDGMQMDLLQHNYPDFKSLALYCYRVASVVGLLSAEIFGYEDRHTLKYAHDLGMAFQLTNILRDVQEDGARGRIYIPQDELQRFGVTPQDILLGRTVEGMEALFAHQAERAREYYDKAFAQLPEIDRYHQRSGIIMAAIYRAILEKIAANRFNVMAGRTRLAPWRKLWLAWRTARQEAKRHHRFQKQQAKS